MLREKNYERFTSLQAGTLEPREVLEWQKSATLGATERRNSDRNSHTALIVCTSISQLLKMCQCSYECSILPLEIETKKL
jgi:hypothetical protein